MNYLTEGRSLDNAARTVRLVIVYKLISQLIANPRNPRKHTKKQIEQIGRSICAFGFLVPVLIDAEGNITTGHGRVEAAKLIGLEEVPTICVSDLSPEQVRAFAIADNRLTENSEWDERLLAEELKALSEMKLDFSLDVIGFEVPEMDIRIQGLATAINGQDPADEFADAESGVRVAQLGDLWLLGDHRVLCSDARDAQAFQKLMAGRLAVMTITDPPYNVRIPGHASGKGAIKHPDFLMASGELNRDEFAAFLKLVFRLLAKCIRDGALVFVFMDWRHLGELLEAGETVFSELKNLCIWSKDRAGMGSLYRSAHELVFVFKSGTASHINNIQLGQFGRYRTNIWNYPSVMSFGRSCEEGNLLALHPTVKPVALVADAILDCSHRGDIVLDSFLGSGTTVIAAERTGRICYGLELDPKYIDVAVRRWQTLTGKHAIHSNSGRTFNESEEEVKRGR